MVLKGLLAHLRAIDEVISSAFPGLTKAVIDFFMLRKRDPLPWGDEVNVSFRVYSGESCRREECRFFGC